jgi:hypothetical protein
MKKIVLIAASIAVILLLMVFILFKTRSPFGKSNSEFSSKPKHEITKIELSQKGDDLTLEKAGDEWLINGKLKARKGGINFIIRILTEAKIKSPVSPELFENEIAEKDIDPVIVRVYEGRKTLKSFRIYKTSSNIYGNIMKRKESTKPFIVYVPGYEVNIGSVFTLNVHYWEPYTIFSLLPSEITSVRLECLQDTASSFRIVKMNGKYSLSGNTNMLSGWNPALIIRYLSYFTFIPFESWVFDITDDEKSAISQHDPIYRITLISSEGYTTVLNLWEKMKNENGKMVIDSDKLLGRTQGNDDFFIVRYFDIDPVLKRRSYFFTD